MADHLGDPTNGLVDQIAAWTPPLLAALSIWLLYMLARTLLDRRMALLAAAIFLLYPGSSLHRSQLGLPITTSPRSSWPC